MSSLTDLLRFHHKHCDESFADAEAAVAESDWDTATRLQAFFCNELESHFGAEEQVLFPAFEAVTGSVGGPTQMMRIEHAQMRELLEQMSAALARRDASSYAGAAETLLIIMQQHNMKEENILYPMCDRSLAGDAVALGAQLHDRLEQACPTPT